MRHISYESALLERDPKTNVRRQRKGKRIKYFSEIYTTHFFCIKKPPKGNIVFLKTEYFAINSLFLKKQIHLKRQKNCFLEGCCHNYVY